MSAILEQPRKRATPENPSADGRAAPKHAGPSEQLGGEGEGGPSKPAAEQAQRAGAEGTVVVAADKTAKQRRRWPVKRMVLGALMAALLAGGAVYGWDYWKWSSVHESTDDAFVDARISQVSPRVAGHVLKVYVNDNQDVKAGEVLLEMDPQPYQAAVDEAKGKLAAAEADLLAAKSEVEQARAQVSAAQASLEQVRADLAAKTAQRRQAEENLAQYKKARGSGVVSAVEWTKIETEARTASATAEAAQKAVTAAEAQVVQAQATLKAQESRVAVAEAQIETAQAGLESANLNLSYTKVVAAEDGRVTKKNVEAGNYVSPGTALMALVSPEVWVTANFKETQLAHMKPGQPVDVTVDSYPGVTWKGHVDSVQQGSGARFSLLPAENATGNYVKVVQRVPVKIVLDGPRDEEHLLGPGMSAEPTVLLK